MAIPAGINASGNAWIGWSFLKFDPIIPPFEPPSGYLLHQEAYKLLPNYGMPSADFAPVYSIERGGIYPSMSKNNVINVYLEITWSAGKGDSFNS